MIQSSFQPGKLVKFRNRKWIVLSSEDDELLLIKPLGGTEKEITGVYLPLDVPGQVVEDDSFPDPTLEEIGAFSSAKLLFNASRLSFRNASGPFRCMGKLSFRPRSYQVVPLVMALKLDPVRLLIADDVGIGKTIEALMILRELMERGDVKNFAVVCPPHLCEQWHGELRDKLDVPATIIKSSTIGSLERKLPDDRSVFYHHPYQVISIDYLKTPNKKALFLNDRPDLVIVDEAHTCALPAGASNKNQQQRHSLLHDMASFEDQHLLLLTATPHSGKDEEFQSLLGLVNPSFREFNLNDASDEMRRKIAKHFIQRKRENIARWSGENTPFPKRDPETEIPYPLSNAYVEFYNKMLNFARAMAEGSGKNGSPIRYWAALSLLRGVMSSPTSGYEMLVNRGQKRLDEAAEEIVNQGNPEIENLEFDSDSAYSELLSYAELDTTELNQLQKLCREVEALKGVDKDYKVAQAVKILEDWIRNGFTPIVFCKYIATAKYIGEIVRSKLPTSIEVQVITSEMLDDQRKEQIEAMKTFERKVLVATDCLSEGINLQDQFTAVLHYDLPWNPNRIEQRNGRVDRYGQEAKVIKTCLMWCKDNPVDHKVMDVLIRKVQDIQKSTGISISLGDDNKSVIDTLTRDILMNARIQMVGNQMKLDFGQAYETERIESEYTQKLTELREKAEKLRNIFAHERIKPEDIEPDLKEVDEAIGDVGTVAHFVVDAVRHMGANMEPYREGYKLYTQNLPLHLKDILGGAAEVKISFESPTPKGFRYIGRNHMFVEEICHLILAHAFESRHGFPPVARVSVVRSNQVAIKTTLIQFRVRNVIKEVRGTREVISEEMYLWGYEGSDGQGERLSYARAKELLLKTESSVQVPLADQQRYLQEELKVFELMKPEFLELAGQRAEHLVEAHGRFRGLVGGRRYEKVTPVLPPDILGLYVIIPQPKDLF